MKKSIVVLALSLVTAGTFATPTPPIPSAAYEVSDDINDKRKEEIPLDELPESVKKSIADKHKGAVISTAYKWYRGDKLIGYEVVITKEDKKDEVVKFDADGKLVKGLDN